MTIAISRISGRRLFAGIGFLLGGLLTGLALFLPWVRVSYPAIAGDPASTFLDVPAHDVATMLQVALTSRSGGILLILDLLLLCAAPLALAAVGAALLSQRGWVPRPRLTISLLTIVLLGAGWAIVRCLFQIYLVGSLDVVRGTRTPEYGLLVALLGYLCALVGTILLPRRAEMAQH
jgi:hypothetical protein